MWWMVKCSARPWNQGHNMLDIALLAAIGKIAYNQGDDLFAYNNSIILAA
jgi:hypothetical protein